MTYQRFYYYFLTINILQNFSRKHQLYLIYQIFYNLLQLKLMKLKISKVCKIYFTGIMLIAVPPPAAMMSLSFDLEVTSIVLIS